MHVKFKQTFTIKILTGLKLILQLQFSIYKQNHHLAFKSLISSFKIIL